MFKLELIRDNYTTTTTSGKLYVNGVFFGYTLEDSSRGENIKIPGVTAIPTGDYQVAVTESQRFKRKMPMIYTEPNGYELISKGISFKGIRIHGGNTHEHSEGCVLIAMNRISADKIQGSLEAELTEKLLALGGKGTIKVVNR
jgi:hypothetical protein